MSDKKGLMDKLKDLKVLVRDNVSPPIVNDKLLEEVESLIELSGKLTAELVHLRLAYQKNSEHELREKEREKTELERQARVAGVDLVKNLNLPDSEELARDSEHIEWLNEVSKLPPEKKLEVINRFFIGLQQHKSKEKLAELRKKSLDRVLKKYTVKSEPEDYYINLNSRSPRSVLERLREREGEYIPPPLNKKQLQEAFPFLKTGEENVKG